MQLCVELSVWMPVNEDGVVAAVMEDMHRDWLTYTYMYTSCYNNKYPS